MTVDDTLEGIICFETNYMTSEQEFDYEHFTQLLAEHKIHSDAAEIQGILCGMLCGGMELNDKNWIATLTDFINQGSPFSQPATDVLNNCFNWICQQILQSKFSLPLCLPDDEIPINVRGKALISWIQGFLLGFGSYQTDMESLSDDLKEGLTDFAEIARLDDQMDDSEESEKAFFEVVEYIKVMSFLCFSELGSSPFTETDTLH
jgi:yecA family protein